MKRISKDEYYLGIAEAVAQRSTCLRRKYGAIIVQNEEIIATGYNGSPRGCSNCCDLGYCERERQKIPQGKNYELCKAIHAEQNAIISAPRRDMLGAELYLYGEEADGFTIENAEPCGICQMLMLNAGIRHFINLTGTFYISTVKEV
jgi:dCMP deaminase